MVDNISRMEVLYNVGMKVANTTRVKLANTAKMELANIAKVEAQKDTHSLPLIVNDRVMVVEHDTA